MPNSKLSSRTTLKARHGIAQDELARVENACDGVEEFLSDGLVLALEVEHRNGLGGGEDGRVLHPSIVAAWLAACEHASDFGDNRRSHTQPMPFMIWDTYQAELGFSPALILNWPETGYNLVTLRDNASRPFAGDVPVYLSFQQSRVAPQPSKREQEIGNGEQAGTKHPGHISEHRS
jgi:hypothetical protein